jgi:large subunit ribosomal protein L10
LGNEDIADFRDIAELETDVDRIEKREFVAELSTVFADTSMVVVTRNEGMTVADVTDLRRRMRAAGASFKVAKNRLALLALDGTRFDGLKPLMKGPTAISWSADPVAVAKAAVDFAKTNEKFVLIGGALGTQLLDVAGVKALAELPSLDALRANLLGFLRRMPMPARARRPEGASKLEFCGLAWCGLAWNQSKPT